MTDVAQPTDWPRIRTVGLSGLLVTFDRAMSEGANKAALAFRAAVDGQSWPEVTESSSTLVSAFFRIDLARHPLADLSARLQDLLDRQDWSAADLPAGRKAWTIPAVFGGPRAPQLDEAAEAAGLSPDQAVSDLTSTRLRVLTIGFAPGQPYLGTLGQHWDVPRLTGLTPNVPQGALVAAVRQICLFSKDTPTGWRHVGQTAFRTFRPSAETPFPLSPGDELTFRAITAQELAAIEADNAAGDGGATYEVLT